MWTPTTREQHSRKALRYQTDLTDAEWVVIEPHLPPAHGTGRPRSWPMREIVNGIFYVMRAGCPWRLLPSDLPPWGTIYRWFAKFRDDGLLEKINHSLDPSRKSGGALHRLHCFCLEFDGACEVQRRVPRAGRHRRARPRARGASGEYPGPRWWRAASVRLTRLVSVQGCKGFFDTPQGRRAGLASAGFSRCCIRGRLGKRTDHHGWCFGLPRFSFLRTVTG